MQVVSRAEATCEGLGLPSLGYIQGQTFRRPTVLVTQQVGGVEDIPVGAVSLILTLTFTLILTLTLPRTHPIRCIPEQLLGLFATCMEGRGWGLGRTRCNVPLSVME